MIKSVFIFIFEYQMSANNFPTEWIGNKFYFDLKYTELIFL